MLLVANPITSSMTKYYEKTKSNYARDIDHLVTFNNNGLWIKENIGKERRIITARKPEGKSLIDVTIFHLDEKFNLKEKIVSKKADIKTNIWSLYEVEIYLPKEGVFKKESFDNYKIESIYNYEKITSLFKNFGTMSFLDLIINYNSLIKGGYNKRILNQNLHTLLSLPFFLLVMTAIAAIMTLNTLKKSDNIRFIILGLITCVLVT